MARSRIVAQAPQTLTIFPSRTSTLASLRPSTLMEGSFPPLGFIGPRHGGVPYSRALPTFLVPCVCCRRVSRPLAFVTGATSGIGAATARALARAGYDVVITGRRDDRLQAMEDELAKLGAKAYAIPFDVRDKQALMLAVETDPHLFDRVDVLVNNAGLALGTDPFHEGDPDEWDEVIDTNVKALLRVTRAILPHMVKRGSGHVVNLGSVAGRWVYAGGAVYCASKFAVRAISEGIRMDVAGSGVRVTNIEPGMVETEFSEVRFRGDAARAKKVYQGFQPLSAEDIADTILWTVSRPPHVDVQELVIYPTAQAAIGMVARDASNTGPKPG